MSFSQFKPASITCQACTRDEGQTHVRETHFSMGGVCGISAGHLMSASLARGRGRCHPGLQNEMAVVHRWTRSR
eukprot:7390866-Prymnesium_polylepis.1